MAGSRFGPRAIREHSLRFCAGRRGYYNPETKRNYLDHEMRNRCIADVGDIDVLPTNVEKTFDNITRVMRRILERGALRWCWAATMPSPIPWSAPTISPCTCCTLTPTPTTHPSSTTCVSPTGTRSGTSPRWPTCRA